MADPRAAAWEAARATWKLANRGDRRFAAERRLFNMQMKEMRRELQHQDLLKRRAAYVAKRDAALGEDRTVERVASRERRARLKAEKADKQELRAAAAAANLTNARQRSAEARERRLQREADFKSAWLDQLLKENEVTGGQSTSLSRLKLSVEGEGRHRVWLSEANLENRLTVLLLRPHSPIERWNGAARKLLEEEQQEELAQKLGGVSVESASPPHASSPSDFAQQELEAAQGDAPLVIQARRDHASVDGSDGETALTFSPSPSRIGGKLSLTERVALLPGEEPPQPELPQVDRDRFSADALLRDEALRRDPRAERARTDAREQSFLRDLASMVKEMEKPPPESPPPKGPPGGTE